MAKSATANLNGKLNLAPGTYTLTVRAWDASGQHTDLQRTITVTAPTLAVNLIFPTTTLVAGGALHIQATGISGVNPAAGMAAYVGSKQVAQSAVPSISTDVSLPAGNYTVTVRVWDTAGASASKQYSVAVQ